MIMCNVEAVTGNDKPAETHHPVQRFLSALQNI